MIEALLFAAIICKNPVIINKTDIWNKIDEKSLKSAKIWCSKRKKCLKKFIKKEQNTYHAICGVFDE